LRDSLLIDRRKKTEIETKVVETTPEVEDNREFPIKSDSNYEVIDSTTLSGTTNPTNATITEPTF
jgi:hypothetical protein